MFYDDISHFVNMNVYIFGEKIICLQEHQAQYGG